MLDHIRSISTNDVNSSIAGEDGVKFHAILAAASIVFFLIAFLAPVKVAPVLFVLGFGLILTSCVLVTIERYEESVIERENRERRKF